MGFLVALIVCPTLLPQALALAEVTLKIRKYGCDDDKWPDASEAYRPFVTVDVSSLGSTYDQRALCMLCCRQWCLCTRTAGSSTRSTADASAPAPAPAAAGPRIRV